MPKPKKKKKKVAAEDKGSSLKPSPSSKYELKSIKVEDIAPNDEQPRKHFKVQDLSESIDQKGVLQPVIVQKNGKEYILVDGERRWRAAKKSGLKEIPALITSPDVNPLELTMIINMQRKDLTPLEEAQGLQALLDDYKCTQEDLAKIRGTARSSLTEILSLNKLPDEIKMECRKSDNYSKSFLLKVVRKKTKAEMVKFWENWKEEKKRKDASKEGRRSSKKYNSPKDDFCLILQYKKDKLKSLQEESLRVAFNKIFQDLGMNCTVSFDIVE
jgi:ParB family chromosome partitioning protein